jgi:hypothetical protein
MSYNNLMNFVNGRLTLTSGVPITTTNVTAATSIYFTPYLGNLITLWNGSYWNTISFTEQSLSLTGLTSGKPFDVFGYLSGSSLALENLIWTNDTTRATSITLQDGRYCKNGDKTKLYLGSFYTTTTGQTEDSETKRFVINHYNSQKRSLTAQSIIGTGTCPINSTSWVKINGGTGDTVEYISTGLGDTIDICAIFFSAVPTSEIFAGIGDDSITTADVIAYNASSGGQTRVCLRINKIKSSGLHYVSMLVASLGGTTNFFMHNNGYGPESPQNKPYSFLSGYIFG